MTIIDANHAVFQFFRQQGDVLDLEENFADLVPTSIDAELEKQIVVASLAQFEKEGLVTRLPHKAAVWVLTRPLDNTTRRSTLPPQLRARWQIWLTKSVASKTTASASLTCWL